MTYAPYPMPPAVCSPNYLAYLYCIRITTAAGQWIDYPKVVSRRPVPPRGHKNQM